jgi:hypothetical protein
MEINEVEWNAMKERMDGLERQMTQLQENVDGLIGVNITTKATTKALAKGFDLLQKTVVFKSLDPREAELRRAEAQQIHDEIVHNPIESRWKQALKEESERSEGEAKG